MRRDSQLSTCFYRLYQAKTQRRASSGENLIMKRGDDDDQMPWPSGDSFQPRAKNPEHFLLLILWWISPESNGSVLFLDHRMAFFLFCLFLVRSCNEIQRGINQWRERRRWSEDVEWMKCTFPFAFISLYPSIQPSIHSWTSSFQFWLMFPPDLTLFSPSYSICSFWHLLRWTVPIWLFRNTSFFRCTSSSFPPFNEKQSILATFGWPLDAPGIETRPNLSILTNHRVRKTMYSLMNLQSMVS